MKLLAWNCRGLGNRCVIQELVDIVHAQDPMIVFLSETWSTKEKMKWVRDKISFDGCFTVTNEERGVVWLFFGKHELMYGLIVFLSTI